MDEDDISEDRTSQQQEDLPYDGDFIQTETYNDGSNDICAIPNQIISTAENHQEKDPPKETYRNVDLDLVPNKMTKNAINKLSVQKKQGISHPHPPANKRDPPKTNISSILLHHLSKEEILSGQGITCETLPETSNIDSCDEAIIKSLCLHYTKRSQLKEQCPELTNQSHSKQDGGNRNESPSRTEESLAGLRGAVATGDRSHRGHSNFLTKIKIQVDKPKSSQGQALQKQKTEHTSSGSRFKYGQGQVHDPCSNLPKLAPKANNPQNNIDRSPTVDKQTRLTPTLRDKLAIVQDILESMARLNCAEKHEQKRKAMAPSCQTQMDSTVHFHQEHLPGMESDTSPFILSSTGHKNVSSSSSYIFQKIFQGSQMCQKLKEQTDQLKTKVEAFSKSIALDSSHHLQDRKQALETLQESHLPEQEFPLSEKEQVTSQQLVYKHEFPALSNWDPERQTEGDVFKLEKLLLEDVKEKADRSKHTSTPLLALSDPVISRDSAATFSPPSNEENPNTSARRNPADRTGPRCVFCHRALDWQHTTEEKGLRKISRDRLPAAVQEKALHPDVILTGTDVQSKQCEICAAELHRSPGACRQEASRGGGRCGLQKEEFHYKYSTPGENYFKHSEKSALLCFLNENKNSSSSCSKSEWICSWRASTKSYEDEYVLIPRKKCPTAFMNYSSDPATPSPPFLSCGFSGGKCCCNVSIKETEPQVLGTPLGHAIRTASILKETTDKMIKTITEDLAKVQRWRNQLKY